MGIALRRSRDLGTTQISTPTGVVMPFAGANSPDGWLLCYGQAVSRTDYSGLFSVIGTTYGTGDGSTTFNLPDMRGRIAAGKDDMGGTAASRLTSTTITSGATTLGNSGGGQTHTLSTTEMPSHTHVQDSHGHQFLGKYGGSTTISSTLSAPGSANVYGLDNSYIGGTTATNQNTGGGGAHNNVQPTIVLNYIIKV
jgi:microcystin-dependent protein